MNKSSLKLPLAFLITALIAVLVIGSAYTQTDDKADDKAPRYARIGSAAHLPVNARAQADAPRDLLVKGSLYFHLNNEAELDELLAEQQDEQSANYRRWLTPEQFGARFGATATQYRAAVEWLQREGVEQIEVWPNRLGIDFRATADRIERAFDVRMQVFELAGQRYYANANAPRLPLEFIDAVEGVMLQEIPRIRPQHIEANAISANFSSGGRVAVSPQDFYIAYNFNKLFAEGIDGSGQTIGIIASSDFNLADVDRFRTLFNLPPVTVEKIPVSDKVTNRGGAEEIEALLDVQLASAAAPRAKIQVVIAEFADDIGRSLAFFVNNLPDTKVINISFGGCERDLFPTFQSTFNNLYKQAAAQGQTVVVSSGDTGANDCRDGSGQQVNGLASSPFVTGVGGTALDAGFDTNGNATGYKGERVWRNGSLGSGGGLSLVYARPSYQLEANITVGRTRAVPDVALLADPTNPGFFYVRNGTVQVVGGTSASAPIWAGIFALTNQFAKTQGLGLVNPRIYRIGASQQQGGLAVFNDVTVGDNSSLNVPGFPAMPGYDLATGWGSPNADLFVRNFTSTPDTGSGLFLVAPNGGEFFDRSATIPVRWRLSDTLGAQVTSQDLLFSTDGGATFRTVAANLAGDARSFNFTDTNMVTTTGRFRILARTGMGTEVIDSSDTDFNIGTQLRIEFVEYVLGVKRLILVGTGLSDKARFIINGVKINKKTMLNIDGDLVVKGKEKQLKLVAGMNTIVLELDGIRSAPYILVLPPRTAPNKETAGPAATPRGKALDEGEEITNNGPIHSSGNR